MYAYCCLKLEAMPWVNTALPAGVQNHARHLKNHLFGNFRGSTPE